MSSKDLLDRDRGSLCGAEVGLAEIAGDILPMAGLSDEAKLAISRQTYALLVIQSMIFWWMRGSS
jgi:hypothetical protein